MIYELLLVPKAEAQVDQIILANGRRQVRLRGANVGSEYSQICAKIRLRMEWRLNRPNTLRKSVRCFSKRDAADDIEPFSQSSAEVCISSKSADQARR